MAVIWADSFDGYGDDETLLLDGLYAQNNNSVGGKATLVDDPDPNESGKVLKFDNGLTHAAATTFRFALHGS